MKTNTISTKTNHPKHHNHRRPCTLRPSTVFLWASFVIIFFTALVEIQLLQTRPTSSPSSQPFLPPSWDLLNKLQNLKATFAADTASCSAADDKLRQAVTFLPLKDLRYAKSAQEGHTWFMSSLHDTHEQVPTRTGEVAYQQFPSASSNGRLLCMKGRDVHDGAWNSYALAWPETLPYNATLMKGLTFISNNHYNYDNIWHGLSSLVPFVAWHIKNGCSVGPTRWVLFHWGELRAQMGLWVKTLMEATFTGPLKIERFDFDGGDEAICFEKAVVMRHNEGGMSRQRRIEVFDLIRCKAREHCNVSSAAMAAEGGGGGGIGMTLFMRTGARSFRNESAVVGIFEEECRKVKGCRLMVAHSNNLTVCEQVKLMSLTDILISPHGAQLTNLFLMDRNSSVMEFYPEGWLKHAGVGQFIYHWMAKWSGMNYQGAWRDPDVNPCPYPGDNRRCMNIYKSGQIGYNETSFSVWARYVLNDAKQRKLDEGKEKSRDRSEYAGGCACS